MTRGFGAGTNPLPMLTDDPSRAAEIESLRRRATAWSVMVLVSFPFGLGLLFGPIAWWRAIRLKERFDALGADVDPTRAQVAILLSAISAVVSWFGLIFLSCVLFGILRGGMN